MRIASKFSAAFDYVLNATGALGGSIMIFLMLVICASIVFRYFLHAPLMWSMRITEALLVYFTFLIAGWVLRKEAHVKMDLLLSRLKPKRQALVNLITSIIAAIIFLIVVLYGGQVTWETALSGYYRISFLEIPDAYILAVIPIGAFLLFVQFLRRAYGNLKIWRDVKKPEAEPA